MDRDQAQVLIEWVETYVDYAIDMRVGEADRFGELRRAEEESRKKLIKVLTRKKKPAK